METPPLTTVEGVDPAVVAAVSSAVRDWCRWHIAPVITEDIEIEWNGAAPLVLPTLRAVSAADVRVDGELVEDVRVTRSGLLRLPRALRNHVVTLSLTHGYEQAPDVVVALVTSMAREAVASVKRGGAKSVRLGPAQMTYESAGTSSGASAGVDLTGMESVLAPYRRPELA